MNIWTDITQDSKWHLQCVDTGADDLADALNLRRQIRFALEFVVRLDQVLSECRHPCRFTSHHRRYLFNLVIENYIELH